MDFELNSLELEISELAGSLLRDHSTPERLLELESSGNRADLELWGAMHEAGLTAVGIEEQHGGAGLGFAEACIVLEQVGRATAAVPALQHMVGLHALQRCGAIAELRELTASDRWLTVSGRTGRGNGLRLQGGRISGEISTVAYAAGAAAYLVPVEESGAWTSWLVRAGQPGLELEEQVSTDKSPVAKLTFADVQGIRLAGDVDLVDWMRQRLLAGAASIQSGVVDEAIRMTTAYVSEREAFGVKIGTFQAVSQGMANTYVDSMVLQLLSRNAAAVLAKQDDGLVDALSAKLMAGDVGHRVLHVCQQVHGGIGHDRGYPLWRYAVAAKHNELATLSSAEAVAELGRVMATKPERVIL